MKFEFMQKESKEEEREREQQKSILNWISDNNLPFGVNSYKFIIRFIMVALFSIIEFYLHSSTHTRR